MGRAGFVRTALGADDTKKSALPIDLQAYLWNSRTEGVTGTPSTPRRAGSAGAGGRKGTYLRQRQVLLGDLRKACGQPLLEGQYSLVGPLCRGTVGCGRTWWEPPPRHGMGKGNGMGTA
jgi:hypothetical protein